MRTAAGQALAHIPSTGDAETSSQAPGQPEPVHTETLSQILATAVEQFKQRFVANVLTESGKVVLEGPSARVWINRIPCF